MIKKITITSLVFAMLAVVFSVPTPSQTFAQCIAGQQTGNLEGYILTENVGNIYISTDSWNENHAADNQTTESFAVSYDRASNIWSGRGWNEQLGWIDFSGQRADGSSLPGHAIIEAIDQSPNGWGGLSPEISLNPISYSTDDFVASDGTVTPAGFQGTTNHSRPTITGAASSFDVNSGAGELTFELVRLVESPCDENVDVLVNSQPRLERNSCSIADPVVSWATENVSGCTVGTGNWGVPSGSNLGLTGSRTVPDVTESSSPQQYSVVCIGDETGEPVEQFAIATCGAVTDPTDPNNPNNPGDPTTGIQIDGIKEA